ncbi:MAG: polyphosphate--glucose phosphotransferase [Acidimicrobiia bacterium]
MTTMLGIDIGGTGIKGAPVDVDRGVLNTDRLRIPTPHPATPDAVAKVVAELVKHFEWTGPVGCTFPAVMKNGVARTAANVDQSWIGADAGDIFGRETGCKVTVLNDADAAGLAEARFGAGRERDGVVIVVTLGTGIGSALFVDGRLVPNTELGHLAMDGKAAEKRAAASVRENKKMKWDKWAKRVNEYLLYVERLFWPDLFIIGGGVSKKSERFLPYIETRAEVVPAQLLNEAGIVGAAVATAES